MNKQVLISDLLQKINYLIDSRKINKSKMAADLQIGRGTMYNYLDGTNDIPLSVFIKLCDYLDIRLQIDETSGLEKAFNNLTKELKDYIDSRIK